MTDKQRNLVLYLDTLCKEKGLKIRATDEDLFGQYWFKYYKNYTPEYAAECINKMKMALGMPITKKGRQHK